MTKTKLVLIFGGALAYALLVGGAGDSSHGCCLRESSAGVSCPALLAWEQPPGVPPTGSGTRPKRSEQLVWEQPPGVPPTGGGTRPKRIVRQAVMRV